MTVGLGMIGVTHTQFDSIELEKLVPKMAHKNRISIKYEALWEAMKLANNVDEKLSNFVSSKVGR